MALAHPRLFPDVLQGFLRVPPPRKSKARTRLEATLGQLGAYQVLDHWKEVKAEKKRARRWRGLPVQDVGLSLRQRLENWVWDADERYDIPSQLDGRERGMYVTMLKELCHVQTPDDWRVAVDYFTDENFHGLAQALESRATPET